MHGLFMLGLDVCSLYPYAMSGDMPAYTYIIRRKEDGFKPLYNSMYPLQYIWLNHIEKIHGRKIWTKLNLGSEVHVDGMYLDGFSIDQDENLHAYEFMGLVISYQSHFVLK